MVGGAVFVRKSGELEFILLLEKSDIESVKLGNPIKTLPVPAPIPMAFVLAPHGFDQGKREEFAEKENLNGVVFWLDLPDELVSGEWENATSKVEDGNTFVTVLVLDEDEIQQYRENHAKAAKLAEALPELAKKTADMPAFNVGGEAFNFGNMIDASAN